MIDILYCTLAFVSNLLSNDNNDYVIKLSTLFSHDSSGLLSCSHSHIAIRGPVENGPGEGVCEALRTSLCDKCHRMLGVGYTRFHSQSLKLFDLSTDTNHFQQQQKISYHTLFPLPLLVVSVGFSLTHHRHKPCRRRRRARILAKEKEQTRELAEDDYVITCTHAENCAGMQRSAPCRPL